MDKLIITLKDLDYEDFSIAGGKAARLKSFHDKNLPLPDALIITGTVFESIIASYSEIPPLVSQLSNRDFSEVIGIQQELQNKFFQLKFPESFEKLLHEKLPLIHFPHFCSVAVRPSPIYRENPEEYIPGFDSSVMNVESYPNLLEALKRVWASHFSRKSVEFRRLNLIPEEMMSMAVIVQKMAKMDYSGTCLSSMKQRADLTEIRACWGMPDGVIKEIVNFDKVTLASKLDISGNYLFEVVDHKTLDKDKMLVYKGSMEALAETTLDKCLKPLPEEQYLDTIGNLAKKAETIFQQPTLITWAHEHVITFLDARPAEDESSDMPLWKLTRLSALAGEVPSPVSASILSQFIEMEFRNLATAVEMDPNSLKNITRELLGRIYYNFNLYERLCRELKIPEEVLEHYLTDVNIFRPGTKAEKTVVPYRFSMSDGVAINRWLQDVLDSASQRLGKLTTFLEEAKGYSFESVEMKVLGQVFGKATELLSNFHLLTTIPAGIILCMVILAKLGDIKQWKDFYRSIPDVDLAFDREYINYFITLYDMMRSSREIGAIFSRSTVEQADLISIKGTEFMRLLLDFIRMFDYMSSCPLDAAEPRFIEDPSMVLALLQHLSRDDLAASFSTACLKELQQVKLEAPPKKSSGLLGSIFGGGKLQKNQISFYLARLIELERQLEEVLVKNVAVQRKIILALGRHFTNTGRITNPEDIFLLTRNEILLGAETQHVNYSMIAAERRKNQETWKNYHLPGAFTASGRIVTPLEPSRPGSGQRTYEGIPINKGHFKGKILKIKSYKDFKDMKWYHVPVLRHLSLPMAPFLINAPGIILESVNFSCSDVALLRRLQIPSVGGYPGIFKFTENEDSVEIDGEKGTVQIDFPLGI